MSGEALSPSRYDLDRKAACNPAIEHREIVAATPDRNIETACMALTRHIENTAQRVESSIFAAGELP